LKMPTETFLRELEFLSLASGKMRTNSCHERLPLLFYRITGGFL
jgi:hypothetical protein